MLVFYKTDDFHKIVISCTLFIIINYHHVPAVSGVCQGSVLGPVLFLIFINDLPEDINPRTRLFADDCILYRQISSENDQQLFQEDLDRLATWEKTWGMEFHSQKCSVMCISRARTPRIF